MSNNPHQLLHAPLGINTVIDMAQMPEDRSRNVVGYLPAREGKLTPAFAIIDQNNIPPHPIGYVGFAFYRDTPGSAFAPRQDYLIVFSGGFNGIGDIVVRALPVEWIDNAPSVAPIIQVSAADIALGTILLPPAPANSDGSFQVRSVQWRDELFVVVDCGGTIPQRIYKDSTGTIQMVQCGINPLDASAFVLTSSAGGSLLSSTAYKYRYTWADEKFRESSPNSVEATITTGALDTRVLTVVTGPADPQIKYIYTYRAALGTDTYYRITPVGAPSDYQLVFPGIAANIFDVTSEADLVVGTPAPEVGQNNPPSRANYLAIHKDRLFLNDRSILTDPTNVGAQDSLQASNLNVPTQFNSAESPLLVGSTDGDEITCFASLGSLLVIFKHNSTKVLYGDGIDDWIIRPLSDNGCPAPGTLQNINGVLFWMGNQNVYAMQGDGVPKPISLEIRDKVSGVREYIQPAFPV